MECFEDFVVETTQGAGNFFNLTLTPDLKNLPLIKSYGSLQALTQDIKTDRKHDLVIAVSIFISENVIYVT